MQIVSARDILNKISKPIYLENEEVFQIVLYRIFYPACSEVKDCNVSFEVNNCLTASSPQFYPLSFVLK